MIAESPGCQGAFTEIDQAERAYRRLRETGIDEGRMSLVVVEDCPACRHEREGGSDAVLDRIITMGQFVGGGLGLAFGIESLWWPLKGMGSALMAAAGNGWVDTLVKLCTLATWVLSGVILGAMIAAVLAELVPAARAGSRMRHRHYVLLLQPPLGREDEVRSILMKSKAIVDEPLSAR